MRPYRLSPTGDLLTQDGAPCPDPAPAALDAGEIEVQHLAPHVERWTLPKGDSAGVLITIRNY